MKSAAKSSKTAKVAKPVRHNKDGYGAHWHSVGWIAAIAIVLSASTMTLAASAGSPDVQNGTLAEGMQDVRLQLNRLEQKIDRLEGSLNGTSE